MHTDTENQSPKTTRGKSRYFYGWNIVGATFLANLSYAEHHSSVLGFFFNPLQQEFGWSRSALAAVQTIARVTEALFAPLVGPMIDRYGPRILMPIGAVIVGLAMLGVTQIDTLWQFYLLRGIVVAIGFTLMGNLVTEVAISNWFVQKRGRALAIGRLGNNLSNIVFVPITVSVIAASGWQTMFVIFAAVTWIAVLIPSIILMRRRPEDMGLYPDGTRYSPAEASPDPTEHQAADVVPNREPVWTRKDVLATRSFWLLALSFGITSLAFQGINISLAPYIQDLGYEDTTLTAVMTARAALMAIALPFMGLVVERSHRLAIRVLPFVVQGIGAFLFLLADNQVFLWLAVALYGVGFSGVAIIQGVIWANYFGRFSLGLVRSLAFLVAFGFGATGPLAMNVVYDLTGTYRPAFMVITGLFLMSAFLIAMVRPPVARRYATPDGIIPSID